MTFCFSKQPFVYLSLLGLGSRGLRCSHGHWSIVFVIIGNRHLAAIYTYTIAQITHSTHNNTQNLEVRKAKIAEWRRLNDPYMLPVGTRVPVCRNVPRCLRRCSPIKPGVVSPRSYIPLTRFSTLLSLILCWAYGKCEGRNPFCIWTFPFWRILVSNWYKCW